MVTEYAQCGKKLVDNGYHIVPIAKNEKRPPVNEWTKTFFNGLEMRFCSMGMGCGIKTGAGEYPIAAIDLDIYDKDTLKLVYKFCIDKIKGVILERVGMAPKRLLVVRTPAHYRKIQTKSYNILNQHNKVEILGTGQQFVAYGIHPSTRKPFEWLDIFGGPMEIDARQLALVSHDTLVEIVDYANGILSGYFDALPKKIVIPDASSMEAADGEYIPMTLVDVLRKGYSITELKKMMLYPCIDYEDWIKSGMALHIETSGSDEGFSLFDTWSREIAGGRYDGPALNRYKWDSFGKDSSRDPVTVAYIEYRYNQFVQENADKALTIMSAPMPMTPERKVIDQIKDRMEMQRKTMLLGGTIHHQGEQLSIVGITGKLLRRVEKKDSVEWRIADESICAHTIAEHIRGFFAYCHLSQNWFTFLGTHWSKVHDQDFINLVKIFLDEGIKRDRVEKGYNAHFVNGICKLLKASPSLRLPILPLRSIPFINGMYQWQQTGLDDKGRPKGNWVFNPISRNNSATWVIPYPYIPPEMKNDTPIFDGMLNNLLPERARHVVYCMIRQALCPLPGIHKVFCFHGAGGAGKSTFIKVLITLSGRDNCYITQFETLENKSNRFELSNIPGKKIIAVMDMGDYKGPYNMTKTISGADYFRCEEKGKQGTYSAMWEGLFIVGANHAMTASNTDSGLLRRVENIPVYMKLNTKKVLKFLLEDQFEKLQEECPVIARRALEIPDEEIYRVLNGNILGEMGYDTDAMREGRYALDPLREFIEIFIFPNEGAEIEVGKLKKTSFDKHTFQDAGDHLYPTYAQWFYSQGYTGYPKDLNTFVVQFTASLKSFSIENPSYEKIKIVNRGGHRYLINAIITNESLDEGFQDLDDNALDAYLDNINEAKK